MYIRTMEFGDYPNIFALWQSTPGIGLSEADNEANIQQFLARNAGMSFVAQLEEQIVGTVLCGHDGRRGYLYHVMVRPDYRRQGIGQALVTRTLAALAAQQIMKCHLFAYADNEDGRAFWQKFGWVERTELVIYSHVMTSP